MGILAKKLSDPLRSWWVPQGRERQNSYSICTPLSGLRSQRIPPATLPTRANTQHDNQIAAWMIRKHKSLLIKTISHLNYLLLWSNHKLSHVNCYTRSRGTRSKIWLGFLLIYFHSIRRSQRY